MNDIAADPEAPTPEDASKLFWVAVYLARRRYGGPEEGGWWFDQGDLVTNPSIYEALQEAPAAFTDEARAAAFARDIRARLPLVNAGRRPIESVLSDGVYEVEMIEADTLPQKFPPQRMTYE